MAGMEKITYPPLIAHLQEAHLFYNQVYLDHELKYGLIDKNALGKWIVYIIEPIIVEATKTELQNLPTIFKVFYSELLRLAGNGMLVRFEKDYYELWTVCGKIPFLINSSPAKILKALHDALESVRMYQPSKTLQWIDMMRQTISSCVSIDDLLDCGRMNAWFCGLAHLREKCKNLWPKIPTGLKNKLEENCTQSIEKVLSQRWINKSNSEFINVSGGFTGFGGAFSEPPLVKDAGSYIWAGDKKNGYLIFADEFGQVLLSYGTNSFSGNTDLHSLKEFKKRCRDKIIFEDISSYVLKNDTCFLTRHSSHYIYIYSWTDGN